MLLRRVRAAFAGVPELPNPQADWEKRHVDRTMRLYEPVMQWVGLFLFNRGLTTFAGQYTSVSLLFPMEQVFEDFVSRSFRRYQQDFTVSRQGP